MTGQNHFGANGPCTTRALRRTWQLDIVGAALGNAGCVLGLCSETGEVPTRRSWALALTLYQRHRDFASQHVQDSVFLGKSGERFSGGRGISSKALRAPTRCLGLAICAVGWCSRSEIYEV